MFHEKTDPFIIGRRIKSARALAGLTRLEFEENHGISAATLRTWEEPFNRNGLTTKGAVRICAALRNSQVICTPEWLLSGEGKGPILESNTADEEKNKTKIPAPHASSQALTDAQAFQERHKNAISIRINDEHMLPFYAPGDYVAGISQQGSDITAILGTHCIVETRNGKTLIRRLERGTAPGLFTLISLNMAETDEETIMLDQELNYAARIIWHRKP